MVPLVHKGLQVIQEQRVLKVQGDHKGMVQFLVLQDIQEHKVQEDLREHKVLKELSGHKVLKVREARKEYKGLKVLQE